MTAGQWRNHAQQWRELAALAKKRDLLLTVRVCERHAEECETLAKAMDEAQRNGNSERRSTPLKRGRGIRSYS